MTTPNYTTVFNGIEMAQKKDGTVEIFCDRPSTVCIADLIEQLNNLTSSTENEEASGTAYYSLQSLPCQHEGSGHKLELGEDQYLQRGI
tara:strand:+ start:119 stop:385 length:267 start_codon:yes stop_codon:yes gene_type:complete